MGAPYPSACGKRRMLPRRLLTPVEGGYCTQFAQTT